MFKLGTSPEEICSFLTQKLIQAELSDKLIIIDPYALAYNVNEPSKNLNNPTDILTMVLRPIKDQFTTLELVIGQPNKNYPEQHVYNLKTNLGLNINVLRAPAFHDRFWIVDNRLAFIVGTSLNNFGHKHFFIQNSFMNHEDTQQLLNLYRNGAK